MKKNLKKSVRELRIEKGWTQERLAAALNISNRTVSAKELGHSSFTEKELKTIAKLFRFKADDIV